MEEEALKKYEENKKAEEAKAVEETKKAAADPKAKKAPPPKKGGKEPDKPVLDVPKLEVPVIKEFQSITNQKYLIERSLDEVTEKLYKPAPTEEEQVLSKPNSPQLVSKTPEAATLSTSN